MFVAKALQERDDFLNLQKKYLRLVNYIWEMVLQKSIFIVSDFCCTGDWSIWLTSYRLFQRVSKWIPSFRLGYSSPRNEQCLISWCYRNNTILHQIIRHFLVIPFFSKVLSNIIKTFKILSFLNQSILVYKELCVNYLQVHIPFQPKLR